MPSSFLQESSSSRDFSHSNSSLSALPPFPRNECGENIGTLVWGFGLTVDEFVLRCWTEHAESFHGPEASSLASRTLFSDRGDQRVGVCVSVVRRAPSSNPWRRGCRPVEPVCCIRGPGRYRRGRTVIREPFQKPAKAIPVIRLSEIEVQFTENESVNSQSSIMNGRPRLPSMSTENPWK